MRTTMQKIIDFWDEMGIESQYGLTAIGALAGMSVMLDVLSWYLHT
jgi:hypothetical protein